MTKALVSITREIVSDDSPDYSYLEQDGWDDRLAEYKAGDFHFVGVRAVATIRTPYGQDFIETQMRSPGLWGIESDSGDDYFQSVFEEEKVTLLDMLESLKDWELT